ncbi:MAG: hypothetical protein ABI430_04885 [Candidatus Taylorbacteria bacterium]
MKNAECDFAILHKGHEIPVHRVSVEQMGTDVYGLALGDIEKGDAHIEIVDDLPSWAESYVTRHTFYLLTARHSRRRNAEIALRAIACEPLGFLSFVLFTLMSD